MLRFTVIAQSAVAIFSSAWIPESARPRRHSVLAEEGRLHKHTKVLSKHLYSSADSIDYHWRCQESGEWTASSISKSKLATETWRWCTDFVVPLDLCPWASASVSTRGALKIYVSSRNSMKDTTQEAAQTLKRDVEANAVDSSVAIAFVVSTDRDWDFSSFFAWFDDLEESFEDDYVTLAPFHPNWEYGDDRPELNVEKQSPYPTVSVVCSSVIEQAGPSATQQIGQHNQEILLDLGISELQRLYQTKVIRA